MKYIVSAALLVGAAQAFTTPPLTFAVGKKAPAKKAKAAATKAVKKAAVVAKKVAKKAAPKPVAATKPILKAFQKAAPKVAPKVTPKVTPKAAPKKVAPKKAAPVKKVAPVKKTTPVPKQPKVVAKAGTVPSTAIPGELAPATLDGSLIGDVGFDPCFLSTKADGQANYFNSITGGNVDGLTWYREAELMHGRICMLAVVGFIWPGFGTLPGNDAIGLDAFSYTNPLEAFSKAPQGSLLQILAFMSALEFRRINNIVTDGTNYMAGDSQKWGQGDGRWNPFGFDYTPEEYKTKQLQELKHARLAMIGFLGVVFQANASGVGVVDQLSAAFVTPEYVAKAGYFLPEGI